jgi:hypothetical protein
MARLDLQGLQVQLALPVQQVQQVLLVQQVLRDQRDKMQPCTQLNPIWELLVELLALAIKI